MRQESRFRQLTGSTMSQVTIRLIERSCRPLSRASSVPDCSSWGSRPRLYAAACIINQTMARRFWPDQNPLGKQVKFVEGDITGTVVGVVGDAKHFWLEDESKPQIYGSYSQQPGLFATAVIRTTVEPLGLSESVRQAVWKVDAEQYAFIS